MESPITKLPHELQRSLTSWHRISCILIAGALFAMAVVHIGAYIYLYRTADTFAQQQPLAAPLNTTEDAVMQQKLDTLDAFSQRQKTVISLLAQIIEKLPDEIRLTHCTITAQQQVECAGQAADTDRVTELVTELHAIGLACTDVTTNKHADQEYPLQFTIKARHCLKQQQ